MTTARRTRRKPPSDGGLEPWVRNLVMVVALLGWAAVVAGYLVKGMLPDAPLLGVPGAVYLAMSPQLLRRKPAAKQSEEAEDPE